MRETKKDDIYDLTTKLGLTLFNTPCRLSLKKRLIFVRQIRQ